MLNSCPIKIAVLISYYNEEVTIAEVVRGFKCELSQGETGKGHVVQAMFRQVKGDVYVMV
jgi:hypothetical protein